MAYVCVYVFTVDDELFLSLRNSNNRINKVLKKKKKKGNKGKKEYPIFLSIEYTYISLPCTVDFDACLKIWLTRFLHRSIQDNFDRLFMYCCPKNVLEEQFITIIICVCVCIFSL